MVRLIYFIIINKRIINRYKNESQVVEETYAKIKEKEEENETKEQITGKGCLIGQTKQIIS